MRLDWEMLPELQVTVMGLGLHGGGVATAAFLAKHGARVTVTDLKTEGELASSMAKLSAYPIRYVLGKHEIEDFAAADLVVKNPAVPSDSPYLKAARHVETDVSIFLSLLENPVIGVTGTKGKSTTASAVHHVLKSVDRSAKIGGNITVSPLSFADELRRSGIEVPVVLELSSWQLGDLRNKGALRARVAIITNILPDHLNRYSGMDDYVSDKIVIVEGQTHDDFTICNYDDPYAHRFVDATSAGVRYFSEHRLPPGVEGAWLEEKSLRGVAHDEAGDTEILPESLLVAGIHNRMNLLAAGLALHVGGLPAETIRRGLSGFPGLPHRLEFVAEIDGRRYYNDSAATIPEATAAAIASFPEPVVLIAGGTDKVLDFAPFTRFARAPKSVVLLDGSANSKVVSALTSVGIPYRGPYDSLDQAVRVAIEESVRGDVILLSPGCTSFGMFANEFDRGARFVTTVKSLGLRGRA